jgi:hypothetical protein
MQSPELKSFRQKLRGQLAAGSLPKNLKLRYRLSGGLPSERLEEELTISGEGQADVQRRDMLVESDTRRGNLKLEDAETRQLFQDIEAGLDSLVDADQAEFVPDSVVGSITLEVGGETRTFFFQVEQDQPHPDAGAGTSLKPAFQRIHALSRQMLDAKRGGAK